MESFTNAETMESVRSGAPLDGDTLAAVSHVDRKTISSRYYHFIKRSFDLCFSFILGIILLIPMLIIALIIKLDSPGPVLFRQERLGKCGRPFTMIKFRSMCIDAEKDGPKWRISAAPNSDVRSGKAAWTSFPSYGTSSSAT